MNKVLIISPHFPPSNLAAVHRSRLFARHLPSYGWEPYILTVHERHYEELPDWELMKLVPDSLKVFKVNAFPLTKPRLIGDLGIRALGQLYIEARKIIRREKIDFLLIHIPSFYPALLGRLLHARTGVQYGIDYIDPWVHVFPGSERKYTRHWLSTKLARLLEPIAVKNAALITGVASGYYEGVFERNPNLNQRALKGAMPYGGEAEDHLFICNRSSRTLLFEKSSTKLQLVYAGALLPKAYHLLEILFKTIADYPEIFRDVEFHFIGTGKAGDVGMTIVEKTAEAHSLWQTTIYEYPARIPYLDVLSHIHEADGVFILGSTEPHYTPSKTYQAVLSSKPIWAVLHNASSAAKILDETCSGLVCSFEKIDDGKILSKQFADSFLHYRRFVKSFDPKNVDMSQFEAYSARSVTGQLAELLNQAVRT